MREREKFLEQSRAKESAFWEKEGKKAAIEYSASIQEKENKLNESRKKAEIPKEVPAISEIKNDSVPSASLKPGVSPSSADIVTKSAPG